VRVGCQSAESTLAGLSTEAGDAGLAGLSTEAGDAGLSTEAGLAGLSTEAGEAGLSTETGEVDAGVLTDVRLDGESLDTGDTMLSLVTLKPTSGDPLPGCTESMPGTLSPVAFSISGMAFATVAAPLARTPMLSADAAPMAIQFLVSMVFLPLACRAARVDAATLTVAHEITRRSR
jgi:hypothetical protein